jgi:N-acetylmuramoyl-L-alanine amidase
MSDDNRFLPPEEDDEELEAPASSTFLEMMRRVASESQPAEEPPAEALPIESPAARQPEPLLPEDPQERRRHHAAALETQRIKRVKRRRARRRRNTVSLMGGFLRSAIMVLVAGGLMATIFVWWTPNQLISSDVRDELSQSQVTNNTEPVIPTAQPTPNWLRKIGVVAGHRGPELDPGAVCPDGLTEVEITFDVAQRVVRQLRDQGFSVDLLDEFDPRLDNYQAAGLVSIHANTCQDFGEVVSGYIVAAAAARVTARGDDEILVSCIAQYYEQETGLERHAGLTEDMTNYHTFREIHPLTPAAIVELGFMLADRDLLTNQPDVVAQGIANGILCFLDPSRPPPVEEESEA